MFIRFSTFANGIWSLVSIYLILSGNGSDCRGVSLCKDTLENSHTTDTFFCFFGAFFG